MASIVETQKQSRVDPTTGPLRRVRVETLFSLNPTQNACHVIANANVLNFICLFLETGMSISIPLLKLWIFFK